MTKLRKQRRRKVYRHNVNRKRLRNKIESVGDVKCKQIKDSWEKNKSIQTNLKSMGLAYDPNVTIKIPNTKKNIKTSRASNIDGWVEEKIEKEAPATKLNVVDELEAEAKAPRRRMFQLPNSHVEWITYLMKKYGTDYRAMARDKKNYNQETWKQIRSKINRFKTIPEQYNKFLEENNLNVNDFVDAPMSDDEL